MAKGKSKNRFSGLNMSNDMKELVNVLSRGGVHSVEDLSDEMNRTKERIRIVVQKVRKRFNFGDKEFQTWVYTTAGGYTIEEKPEHMAYESRLRLNMGLGVILNGAHVLNQMKRLALKDFNGMMIEYKPRMLEMGKVIK